MWTFQKANTKSKAVLFAAAAASATFSTWFFRSPSQLYAQENPLPRGSTGTEDVNRSEELGRRFPGALQKFISVPSREESVNRMKEKSKVFDVLVIGGGATGTGVALDAATRGLSVALVEKDDFASGTSSRSTKLIHGGVRYLEKAVTTFDLGALKLVFEALHERANFLHNAPHLTHPLPIMTPCYKWWEVPYYYLGLKVYDLLAGREGLYWSYWLGKRESVRQFPVLHKEGLKGTVVYYDGQMDDSRVNVSLALTASHYGAAVANHVEVLSLLKDPLHQGILGARVADTITGEEWDIRAQTVVNATGPFTDSIRKMDDPKAMDLIAPSSGVHVVLPDYYSPEGTGLIVPKTKDGRVVFMLPWEGQTIAGTTDSSTSITHFPKPHEEEVGFILEALSDYLTVKVRREDVRAAWSGIRPLARDPKAKNTASISRDHVIHVEPSGLITITGGKWTTYRRMAQDTVDTAIKVGRLKPLRSCQTKHTPVLGAYQWEPAFFTVLIQNYDRCKTVDKLKKQKTQVPLPSDIAQHLSHYYGTRAMRVAEIASKNYGDRLNSNYPYIEAEVVYAVQEEYARTVVDVIARRTRLAFVDAEIATKVVPRVTEIMADILKWDKRRIQKEQEEAQNFLDIMNVPKPTLSPLKGNINFGTAENKGV